MNLKKYIKRIDWKRTGIGALIGTVIGFAYYYFIGCKTGVCKIQSNPFYMSFYGALLGAIILFRPKKTDA